MVALTRGADPVVVVDIDVSHLTNSVPRYEFVIYWG
jgi:hypothetical protein